MVRLRHRTHQARLICVPVDLDSEAPLLKLLGEPLRWTIIRRLADEDLCVCHLVDDLGLAQPLVSHHLRALREAGLVTAERCGAFTYYVLNRPALRDLGSSLAGLGTEPPKPRRRPCG